MADVRAIWAVGRIRFRAMLFSYRSAAVAVLIGLYVFTAMQPFADFARAAGVRIVPWGFPFLTNDQINQLFFMIGAIALLASAPFDDALHPYLIARAGRARFVMGNALGILGMSAAYVLFLLIASVAPLVSYMEMEPGWGRVWTTLGAYQSGYDFDWAFFVSDAVRAWFSPARAMTLSFLLETGCVFLLGMLVYLGNRLSRRPLGLWLAGAAVMLDVTIWNLLPDYWFRWSPLSLARLSQYIRKPYMPLSGSVAYGFLFYGAGALICLIILLLCDRRGSNPGREGLT